MGATKRTTANISKPRAGLTVKVVTFALVIPVDFAIAAVGPFVDGECKLAAVLIGIGDYVVGRSSVVSLCITTVSGSSAPTIHLNPR